MINESLLDRALGAYLGFVCGDALEATIEFMSPKQIQLRYGVQNIPKRWLNRLDCKISETIRAQTPALIEIAQCL